MSKESSKNKEQSANSSPHVGLDERVNLKDPWVAGILAYLIPGAGHFYQGRYFKAVVYSFCILGIFFWGSAMGDDKTVTCDFSTPKTAKGSRTIGYIAQVGVGLPALPAIVQSRRYKSQKAEYQDPNLAPGTVLEQFDTVFTGSIYHDKLGHHEIRDAKLTGSYEVGEYGVHQFKGRLTATGKDGEPLDLKLLGVRTGAAFERASLQIGPKICALDEITPAPELAHEDENFQRQFSTNRRNFVVAIGEDEFESEGTIFGTIPRSFTDHYQVPLEPDAVYHLIRQDSKRFELSWVYTWIAGLLNVLAVWDAVQGPAYGYGDEPELDAKKSKKDDSETPEANAELAAVSQDAQPTEEVQ